MTVDVLAVGAHPDDVELGCGGTLARLASRGRRVGILHLTSGELGTRGDATGRRREAEKAAAVLGAAELVLLDCGDGALRTGRDEEDAVIDALRRLRPKVVLGPTPEDRHPDHGRAFRLVRDACFYSGLAGRGADRDLAPHRPAAMYSYMQHDLFAPSFVVDVSAVWDTKVRALEAYRSQLAFGGESSGPVTKVSTAEFAAAVEGRARHFGQLIGAAHGEPFWSRGPLRVDDPLAVVPGGTL